MEINQKTDTFLENYLLSTLFSPEQSEEDVSLIEKETDRTELNGRDNEILQFFCLALTYGDPYALSKMSPQTQSSINNPSRQETGKKWKNYVIRKPRWKELYNNCSQKDYGILMHHTVLGAATGIKEQNWSFSTLLKFLQERRRAIAMVLVGFHNALTVGWDRDVRMKTACTCIYYGEIVDRFIKRFKLFTPNEQNDIPNHLKNSPAKEGERVFTYYEKIGDQEIKLSKIKIYEKLKKNSHLGELKAKGGVEHASVVNIPKIMKYIEEDLYPNALQEKDSQKLTRILGRIFWWICQAKPWIQGDPSIAESLIRTIWTVKGMESPRWQKNIVPWEEVMFEPQVDKFAKKFHLLFEWSTP